MHLVTGGTGKAGRQVVARLLEAGEPIRVLTRDAGRALPEWTDVEVVEGDLNEPRSWNGAFDGVVGAHLLTAGGDDYAALRAAPELVARLERAGVSRVTLLWNGAPGPVEEAFAASSIAWTRLEAVDFMGNTLAWVEDVARSGRVAEPFADTGVAMVHEADVGAVAAEVLLRGGFDGASLTVTGPSVVTPRERVEVLGRVLGRPLALDALSEAEARARMRASGVEEGHIDLVLDWQRDPPAAARTPSGVVERLTGRPGRTFADWAAEHAGAFGVAAR